jgi:hypothetical protein
LHTLYDRVTEWLLIALILFTPWAFGTTQTWSIWTANILCYGLGGLLVAKWVIRRQTGFRPVRWGEPAITGEESGEPALSPRRFEITTTILAVITALVLTSILASALNARADYNEATRALDYLGDPLGWLPASYDRGATWSIFWQYLGLACAFWAVRDWLLHRSPEDRREQDVPPWAAPHAPVVIPARLRRLLWVLFLNATLLAIVSIVQRAEGTNRLLWIVPSASNKPPEMIFGPWPYRGNAAQYFNLVWPVCLAFWLWSQERAVRSTQRRGGRFDGPQLVLLPCAIFAGVCPMISSSRGGAIVSAIAGVIAVLLILVIGRREVSPVVRWITTGGMVLAGLSALVGGWSIIHERLSRPDMRMPTGIEANAGEFTLLMRARFPEASDGRWVPLGSLCGNARMAWHPNTLHAAFGGSGVLAAQLLGSATTNINRVIATNFLQTHGGRDVLLGFVRKDGLRIYADGTELGVIEGTVGDAPDWNSYVFTRYMFIGTPLISEVGLVNFAMTPEELAAAAAIPLESLVDQLLNVAPFSDTDAAFLTSPILPEGAEASLTSRATDRTVQWLTIRRHGSTGPLGFGRELDGLDPRLRGPLRAALTAWNPNNEPIYLGISLDGGPRGVAEIPSRAEKTVVVPCRASHSGTPQVMEVSWVDADGELIEVAPGEAEILVRDLHLLPGGSVFGRRLTHDFRLLELGDRMSGRNEVYESSLAMARDFPFWGSGPGSFASLFQLYLKPGQDWAAYAHNDWLETRITFGPIGVVLVIVALGTLLVRSWLGRGLRTIRIVIALWWLALAGCLVHARFDFPFQIYSVLFLFMLLCAVLMALTARLRA